MEQILTGVYVTVVVVLLFGASIFLHEFGHYWMARRRGLKVEAFAIGFGPKIFGWTRDGIEYSWRWIPAGGYVKLPQMVTSQTLEGTVENPEKIPPASPFSKILVAAAGPFMNVVFAFAVATVIYFAGLPVPVNPSFIGYVDPGSEEFKLGIKEGDRIVAVDGKPVKSWENVQHITVFALTNVLPVTIERAGTRKIYHLKADASPTIGLKVLNLDPREHPIVNKVGSGTPAEIAGLKQNDKIVSFAGIPVFSQMQVSDLVKKRVGEASEIVVERNGRKESFAITPFFDEKYKRGRLGIEFLPSPTVYEVQKPGPTPWQQVAEVWTRTIETFNALFHSKQTGVGAKDLSGPVGILSVLALQVKTDYRLALNFLVLLNINLAILNMLPVPVLDGGHIMMALIERIRRRPLSPRFVEYTTSAFAVLLISFMLYVTFFDIKRFPLFHSMFKRETQIEQMEKPSSSSTNAQP